MESQTSIVLAGARNLASAELKYSVVSFTPTFRLEISDAPIKARRGDGKTF